MIIKIDMDGVIRNIFDNMCALYNKAFGRQMTVDDIFDYDVDVAFPKIKEEIGMTAADYFFDWESKEIFLESSPYDGVREAIERLQKAGHKVVIVTWQYTLKNKFYTLMFLERNNIHYDDICFTKDKWMIQGDWLIDDNPEFILDTKDIARKIMINMPYNTNTPLGLYMRKDNLKDAVDLILNIEENVKYFKIDTKETTA